MKKIVISALMLLVVLSGSMYAQERTITGKVTDASDGSGLPGVNIAVKGTAQGTITDMDGNYSIKIPGDNASLLFSFMGYTAQTIAVGSQITINVALVASDVGLEEVVVTALGITKEKKALGYAVTEVGGDILAGVKETNVVNSLAGRVAGVTLTQSTGGVGSGTRVIIRGNNSITGNNQPLYVVDGLSIDNSGYGSANESGTAEYTRWDRGTGISDINPDDIESITVLKGPNAAALYGSRAANGVILITTKKGKAGKGIGVSYSLQTTFDNPMILPKYQNEYGQGASGLTYTDIDELRQYSGSWGAKFDGSDVMYWKPIGKDANGDNIGENRPYVAQENNVKDFFQTGVNMVNTVALDGGSENTTFRFSYTNNTNNGMLENSWLKKNNFNLRATHKINRLSLDAKVTYFTQDVNNRAEQGSQGIMAYMWDVPRNLVLEDYKDYQDPSDFSVITYTDGSGGNPYWVLHQNVDKDSRNRMQGFVKATYELTDFLSVFVRAGTDLVTQKIEIVSPPGHWFRQSGAFDYSTQTNTESNADFLFMFNKELSSDMNLSANFGGNMLYQTYNSQRVHGVDFKIPTKYTTSSAAELDAYYTPLREKKIHSLYGNISLSYKNFAYLDLSGRNDWSSTLPENNWSYFYPSFSLAFLLNEVIQPIGDMFDLFKVRGSWAKVGSDTDPYQIDLTYDLNQDGYLGLTTLSRPDVKMNANLKPEQTTSLELGLELSMFNNRMYGDFSYYKIESSDLIFDVPVPAATGYQFFRENVGLMINEGAEFQIGGIPVKTPNFSWDISFNFGKNNNRLVELIEELESYTLSSTNAGNIKAQATVGGGYGDLYGYTYRYDDQGRMIVEDNGIPLNSEEMVYLGNFQPDWTGGIYNSLKYKALSLNFLIDIRYGGQLYSGTDKQLDATGVSERTLEYRETGYIYEDAVLADGTANTTSITGSEYWNNLRTSDYIYDQTNIRLRELSLTYNLPKSLLDNIFINDVSISVIGRNLFFLYKEMENFDPESSYSTSNYAQGMLFYNMPTTRSFGFNLNIKF